ncbi:hypothetical protein [Sneathiella chinensis]|uniref:DUF4164 domain-containing protein n=2 Tax=Sneathiella chinensis TaxID=349750 RepID=A0ABQ5U4Z5_9PROT|nr:hypothetical protein [Sneathiella chinensis]GLQ06318.1 hypothetical protein GCM10007924_15390 [Sneathiella chinensis]
MGSEAITESRMEAALMRLDAAAEAILERPMQGAFDMVADDDLKEALDKARAENRVLRNELMELGRKYEALKKAAGTVTDRLDGTIGEISSMLER